MADFSSQFRQMIAEHPSVNPYDVAADLADRLTDAECREALRLALPQYVKMVDRSHGTPAEPVTQRSYEDATAGVRAMGEMRRLAWLNERTSLGNGTFKRLGDLTAAELRICADIRFSHAAASKASAERYLRWAAMVEQAGVHSLIDLAGVDGIELADAA